MITSIFNPLFPIHERVFYSNYLIRSVIKLIFATTKKKRLMQEQLQSLREGKQILKSDVVSTRKEERTIRPLPVTTTGEVN